MQNHDNENSPNASIIWGSILALAASVVYVLLRYLGDDSVASYIGFISPFIAVLLLARQTDRIEEKTEVIKKNTNGMLSAHVDGIAKAAALAALSEKENQNGR